MSSKQEITSVSWKFFKKVNLEKDVKCKCGKVLKYSHSTTGMISHIRSNHLEEMIALEKTQRGTRATSSFTNSVTSHAEASDSLVLALSTSNVPFRFVRNEWFKNFCRLLDPDFRLLSPDSIRRKLERNGKAYVENVKEQLNHMEKCFVTFDGWDGKYDNVSLYALFVYFVDVDYSKKKLFLGIRHLVGESTADNIGDLVTDLLSEFNIDFSKVMGAICDAGSNLTSFLNRNTLYHLHCAAHSLALIVKSAAAVPSISAILVTVNALAAHLSRSKSERKVFRERSTALKIHGRIPLPFSVTRWGGCVLLATAYLEHYQSITSLTRFQKFLLSESEKEKLQFFVDLTTPYVEAITGAESDATYCSEILVQYASLHEFISSQSQHKQVVRVLKDETQKRFLRYLENDVALLATFCDPRFAYLDGILLNKPWEVIEKLVENYCDSYRVVRGGETTTPEPLEKRMKHSDSFFSKFIESKRQAAPMESAKNEIVNYEQLIMSGRPPLEASPLQFWNNNCHRFPKLCRLARHVLCSPQSSAQVERLFSRCGEIVSSSRRNRMSAQTMNDLLLNSALGALKKKDSDESLDGCSQSDEDSEGEEEKDDSHSLWISSVPPRCRSTPPGQ